MADSSLLRLIYEWIENYVKGVEVTAFKTISNSNNFIAMGFYVIIFQVLTVEPLLKSNILNCWILNL